MEGQPRPRQRGHLVFRRLTPSRLQDDLLSAVYDRLLAAGSLATKDHGGLRGLELRIIAEPDQPATTGG
jgi:hypothetical protein